MRVTEEVFIKKSDMIFLTNIRGRINDKVPGINLKINSGEIVWNTSDQMM